jgi:lipoate-protein ligase A
MALDEALLRTPGAPTLRLYGWSPPGLSLGYFQAAADFQTVPGDHVVVRRITGGGAIYHADEITFALTADANVLPGNVPASYELIHSAVATALERIGVATVMAGTPRRKDQRGAADPWCFADPSGADLVTAVGGKIFGSAQRRMQRPRPRILHHGSLVVRAPAATPSCGSVAQHGAPDTVLPPLAEALIEEISAALGLSPQQGSTTMQEEGLAEGLSRGRYGSPDFTRRR